MSAMFVPADTLTWANFQYEAPTSDGLSINVDFYATPDLPGLGMTLAIVRTE